MTWEAIPCRLCGVSIEEGQLCDTCKGLSEHRNILNGVEEERVKEALFAPEDDIRNCNDCGEEFTPWQNGARIVTRVCEPCTKRKRSAAQKKYHKGLTQESTPELCCDYFVGFGAEPELAGRIAASATRCRRTFEQQVFWMLSVSLALSNEE